MLCDANGDFAYQSFGGVTIFYSRVYLYLTSHSSTIQIMQHRAGTTSIAVLSVQADSDVQLQYRSGSNLVLVASVSQITTGAWYCVEMQTLIDGANGEFHVWIDGVELEDIAQTGIDNNNYGNITQMYVGISYTTGSVEANFDCVVAADAYIGPEEEGPTLVEVADSLELAETTLRNKTLILPDSLGLAEALYGNKALLLSDSASLSELSNVLKTLKASDALALADTVSTPARVLQALEAIGLADNFVVSKVLQINETVSLTEAVQVGTGGTKKTKLFLILGDLAMQLTGD
jgi:hypothetical protein